MTHFAQLANKRLRSGHGTGLRPGSETSRRRQFQAVLKVRLRATQQSVKRRRVENHLRRRDPF